MNVIFLAKDLPTTDPISGIQWTSPVVRPRDTSKGRCIALYPGAFKPAHKVHFAAIVDLASRPGIDEVVVIIANRSRYIPGTTKVLDANVARRVLSIYLCDIPKVRVEIAPHNAVTHALGYLERADPGDSLLFCVGEADFDSGDDRFEDIVSLNTRADVSASVLPLPTATLKIRATELRQALAEGDTRRDSFMAALPEHLSEAQRESVWLICRTGMREMNDIIEGKLRALLDPKLVGDYQVLSCVVPGKLDPVFRLRRVDGTCLFVKYAGETAESGSFGLPLKPKPRRRLSTERRAIKCLRANLHSDVDIAEVVYFNKESSTLVLSEVCPNGERLQDSLRAGVFDPALAIQASQFLAACHTMVGNIPALWGEHETDLRHWRAMLALRTVEIESTMLSPKHREYLQSLSSSSDSARRKGFFLLDYCPKNILVRNNKIGVIDLELCSGDGDPAYDLGIFLGHYVLWGIRASSGNSCGAAIREALKIYSLEVGADWMSTQPRVAAFAGAGILHTLARDRRIDVKGFESRLIATATGLLVGGLDVTADPEQLLMDAVANRLA